MTVRAERPRIGIVGYGGIGRGLAAYVLQDPRLDLAFAYNRTPERLADVDPELVCTDLTLWRDFGPTLVVEAAHPSITEEYGADFVASADYLPVSTSVLVDDDLRERLVRVARSSGTRLHLPHGALVGLDALVDVRDVWDTVRITFVKHPSHLDGRAADVDSSRVLYEGSVRGIARQYPRNVNAMVTLALATVGLDRCEARLVADPQATQGRLEIEAHGRDGSRLTVTRSQPMEGVSGSEMYASTLRSLLAACGLPATDDRLAFV